MTSVTGLNALLRQLSCIHNNPPHLDDGGCALLLALATAALALAPRPLQHLRPCLLAAAAPHQTDLLRLAKLAAKGAQARHGGRPPVAGRVGQWGRAAAPSGGGGGVVRGSRRALLTSLKHFGLSDPLVSDTGAALDPASGENRVVTAERRPARSDTLALSNDQSGRSTVEGTVRVWSPSGEMRSQCGRHRQAAALQVIDSFVEAYPVHRATAGETRRPAGYAQFASLPLRCLGGCSSTRLASRDCRMIDAVHTCAKTCSPPPPPPPQPLLPAGTLPCFSEQRACWPCWRAAPSPSLPSAPSPLAPPGPPCENKGAGG